MNATISRGGKKNQQVGADCGGGCLVTVKFPLRANMDGMGVKVATRALQCWRHRGRGNIAKGGETPWGEKTWRGKSTVNSVPRHHYGQI